MPFYAGSLWRHMFDLNALQCGSEGVAWTTRVRWWSSNCEMPTRLQSWRVHLRSFMPRGWRLSLLQGVLELSSPKQMYLDGHSVSSYHPAELLWPADWDLQQIGEHCRRAGFCLDALLREPRHFLHSGLLQRFKAKVDAGDLPQCRLLPDDSRDALLGLHPGHSRPARGAPLEPRYGAAPVSDWTDPRRMTLVGEAWDAQVATPLLRYFVVHGEAFRPRLPTPAEVCEWIVDLARRHHPGLPRDGLLALLAPLGVVERRSEVRRVVRCPHCQRCSSMDSVFLEPVISLCCGFCGGASEARFRWRARAAFELGADIESVRAS